MSLSLSLSLSPSKSFSPPRNADFRNILTFNSNIVQRAPNPKLTPITPCGKKTASRIQYSETPNWNNNRYEDDGNDTDDSVDNSFDFKKPKKLPGLRNCVSLTTSRKHSSKSDFFDSKKEKQLSFTQMKIVKKIGQGSFGTVFKCYDPSNGKYMAVKKSSRKLYSQHGYYLRKESKMVNYIIERSIINQHENILYHYQTWNENDYSFIANEYCPYDNLKTLIDNNSDHSLYPTTIALLIFHLANGLDHLHRHHITHLDIKLENLLISESKMLKIADFGIAIVEGNNIDSVDCGDGKYAAPEFFGNNDTNNVKITAKVDVYSMGIILFELLFQTEAPKNGSKEWHELRDSTYNFYQYHADIIKNFTSLHKYLYMLLQHLLHGEYEQRYSAEETLKYLIDNFGQNCFFVPTSSPYIYLEQDSTLPPSRRKLKCLDTEDLNFISLDGSNDMMSYSANDLLALSTTFPNYHAKLSHNETSSSTFSENNDGDEGTFIIHEASLLEEQAGEDNFLDYDDEILSPININMQDEMEPTCLAFS